MHVFSSCEAFVKSICNFLELFLAYCDSTMDHSLLIRNGMLVHNLNNYFDFHVCLSFLRPPCVCPCVRKIIQIPAALSQNVTNKKLLGMCYK